MSRDLRRYARQTNRRLFIGFLMVLFIVGDGLIYLIFGLEPALLGLTCMLMGLAPLVLVWLAMGFIGWLARLTGGD